MRYAFPLFFVLAACRRDSVAPPSFVFREAAEQTGLGFVHHPQLGGQYHLPEIMGAGAALLDYDSDGDLDVYLVQNGAPGNKMFRNDIVPSGRLQFTDVTGQTGTGHADVGMGAAVGDYDRDGDPDLFVTNFGANILYRNNGDSTFAGVTRAAGLEDSRWSTSASFFDYDRDGDLDLFYTAYVDFTVKGNVPCFDSTGARDYCNPSVYRPLPDRLFRNDSNGRFTNVSTSAGLGAAFGSGMGTATADFNGDGWPDIFVANDGNANQLWINQGDGTFRDAALEAGVAYNADGAAQAGMGIAAADFDGDGDDDVFITHLAKESNVLYVNDGKGIFLDRTIPFRLNRAEAPGTGFGTDWFDADNDGDLDLFVANGAVTAEEWQRGEAYPYRQRPHLFVNEDGRSFREVSLGLPLEVGRGAAFGDIDNDGDADIVLTNNNGPVRLLLNEMTKGAHWLLVRVIGGEGTRVALHRRGKILWRRVRTDGSYLSASDSRVHFGLGSSPEPPEKIVVEWPGGVREDFPVERVDTVMTLRRRAASANSPHPRSTAR